MKYFVTTPIYYVNAKPHIGHIYTTIAADVLARWQRLQGNDVLFSTGTDENSQKNVTAAEAAGQPVGEYVDAMAAEWAGVFKQLDFTHDVFVRTTSSKHHTAVKDVLAKIEAKGDIYKDDYEGFYCVGCEAFVSESDLVGGKCPIHDQKPQQIKEKNYFFRLTKYKKELVKYCEKNVYPLSARKEILSYIKNELTDISISRQSQEWGIKLPQDEKHVVYVWFDALINYLTVTGYPKPSQFWPPDTHIIGKDIIKFHCAIWPAMLLSAGLSLPNKIFAHGFFTIDGHKISKSLGNAIDPLELIKEYPFDAIRYYLLRDIPFGNDGDFSHERLKDRYNADLANGLGNLVSRTLNMIENFLPLPAPRSLPSALSSGSKGGEVGNKGEQEGVNPKETLSEETTKGVRNPKPKVPDTLSLKLKNVDTHIQNLTFDKALENIWSIISDADELIEETKPWQLAKRAKGVRNSKQKVPDTLSPSEETRDEKEARDKLEKILCELFHTLIAVNNSIAPFLPDTHIKLTKLLAARPIKKPAEPLFARKG